MVAARSSLPYQYLGPRMRRALAQSMRATFERPMPLALPAPAPVLRLAAPPVGYAVVESGDLKRALDECAKFVAKRSTLPVLANVLIDAKPGALTLSATNLDMALTVRLTCKGRSYFSLCVPLATLRDMLSRVDSVLSLTTEGYTLVIRKQSSGGIIRVKGMDAGEYPTIPSQFAQHYFSVDSARLSKEIERVARAAATDEARPVFTALLAHVADGSLTLAAADSYRLHVASLPLDRQGHAGECLIPAKTLTTLASILPKKGTPLHVWTNADALGQFVGSQQIAFRWNGHTVMSRLIDGAFPAYQRIMPDTTPLHYAVVDAKALREAVELVGKVVDGDSNSIIHVGWLAGKVQQIVIDGQNENASQTEYVKADLDKETWMSQAQYIMLNYHYLADALKSISGYAVLRFWTPKQPPTVRPLETEDTFVAVVMPMHTIR